MHDTKIKTVRLTENEIDYIAAHGDGNFSQGIKNLIADSSPRSDHYFNQTPYGMDRNYDIMDTIKTTDQIIMAMTVPAKSCAFLSDLNDIAGSAITVSESSIESPSIKNGMNKYHRMEISLVSGVYAKYRLKQSDSIEYTDLDIFMKKAAGEEEYRIRNSHVAAAMAAHSMAGVKSYLDLMDDLLHIEVGQTEFMWGNSRYKIMYEPDSEILIFSLDN